MSIQNQLKLERLKKELKQLKEKGDNEKIKKIEKYIELMLDLL
jgi:hypothetical protein